MRVRAIATRNVTRPRLNAAYHASNNAQRSLAINKESKDPILQDLLPPNSAVAAGSVRPQLGRLRKYLPQYLPFDEFSSSLYSVPLLLLFRLFYPAAPYAVKCALRESKFGLADKSTQRSTLMTDQTTMKVSGSDLLNTYSKMDVRAFNEAVASNPELAQAYRISALTWVKALASPLSHEFLQIIVEHAETGQRYRLVTERTETGDSVTVGWDWASHDYASHHHVLPLPLLSIVFKNNSGPSLGHFSTILTEISKTQEYNLLREMCWWYAERVFVRLAQESHGVSVKHWPCAFLRYSFVVQNKWIRRRTLVNEAERFRSATRNQMMY